jgi:hypothetical protein
MIRIRGVVLVGAATLAGCATIPEGPSVMALPGAGKSYEAFREDAAVCQMYAQQAIGETTPGQAATDSAIKSGAAGTAIGAAAGALIGAATGDPGVGAAIGAGGGLLVGSTAGTGAYGVGASTVQDRYDATYVQCMYAKGNKVPVSASYETMSSQYSPPPPNQPPPPGADSATPPPPGTSQIPPGPIAP